MTSNYNKVKNKEDKLAKASQVRKNTGAVKSENVLVGNTSHISGVSGKVRAGENGKTKHVLDKLFILINWFIISPIIVYSKKEKK